MTNLPSAVLNTCLPSLSTKITGLVTRSLNNWLPLTASLESLEIAPSAKFVILVSPALIPVVLIVTVFTVPPADVLVKVAPPLAKANSVLPVVVSPPLDKVNPLVVLPVTDVILVNVGLTLKVYLLASVPSPETVVFVPFANFGALAVVDTVYVF